MLEGNTEEAMKRLVGKNERTVLMKTGVKKSDLQLMKPMHGSIWMAVFHPIWCIKFQYRLKHVNREVGQ
jgi:hypothetical protein